MGASLTLVLLSLMITLDAPLELDVTVLGPNRRKAARPDPSTERRRVWKLGLRLWVVMKGGKRVISLCDYTAFLFDA